MDGKTFKQIREEINRETWEEIRLEDIEMGVIEEKPNDIINTSNDFIKAAKTNERNKCLKERTKKLIYVIIMIAIIVGMIILGLYIGKLISQN